VRGEKKLPTYKIIKLKLQYLFVLWEDPTAKTGLTAEVIEVHSIKLAELGVDKIKGKIVFFNRPMDNEEIESFHAYSGVIREILVLVKQQSLELSGLLYVPQFKIG
jgi:hypothetical protein